MNLKNQNPQLKIAVLGTRGFPNVQGGVEAHCENLYPQLVKRGCEVIVFTRKPYVNPDVSTYEGVKLIPLSCPKSKFLEAFYHTFFGVLAARRFSPDILHIHAIGPSLMIPFARILGFKVVMTHHGPDYQRGKWGKLAKVILKLGEKLGIKWSNSIIVISQNIANHIKETYNRDVTVIPNGVIIPEIIKSNNIIKKYRLENGKYILAVGRFVPEKGFHDLIEAFKQIQNSGFQSKIQNPKPKISIDHWKLVIVGRADHEGRYSIELKEKAVKNSDIILTGFLTEEPLRELYSHAGLFVLPSHYEGLPIVLLEAMSYGLSCIASDIPANRNVELSENRFFKAGDNKALALKIKEFIDKHSTEDEIRRQINIIAEKYNWEKIAEKTLDVYAGIYSNGNK
jgi:glycosyltransferase involved in cell wall biosynthesis